MIVKGGPNANVYAYAGGRDRRHRPAHAVQRSFEVLRAQPRRASAGTAMATRRGRPAVGRPAGRQPAAPRSAVRPQPAGGRSARGRSAARTTRPRTIRPPTRRRLTTPPADTPPADTPPAVVPPASTPAVVTPPATQVLARSVRSGRSRMRGTSGCAGRMVKATVSGRRIAKVVFRLDGRIVKTTRGAGSYAVRSATIGFGRHRIVARVTYKAGLGHAPAHPRADVPALRAADARAALHRLSSRTGGCRAARPCPGADRRLHAVPGLVRLVPRAAPRHERARAGLVARVRGLPGVDAAEGPGRSTTPRSAAAPGWSCASTSSRRRSVRATARIRSPCARIDA